MGSTRLLISDLDGTLLGDPGGEALFAAWMRSARERWRLVYATGRTVGSVRELVRSGRLVEPDAIVSSVGTRIHDHHGQPWPGWPPVADAWARDRVEACIRAIGGIEPRTGVALGRDMTLAQLRKDFDAVFLGMGLAGVNALQAEGEGLAGVIDAVAYIAELRQAKDKSRLPVGRRVVVIGGGNTAIDIAVQTKRLGAEDVTIVYRRGPEHMGATWHEQEFAQVNGVKIKHWARPVRVIGENGHAAQVEFEYTALDAGGRLVGTNSGFALPADQVFKAIGQSFIADPVVAVLTDVPARPSISGVVLPDVGSLAAVGSRPVDGRRGSGGTGRGAATGPSSGVTADV